MKEKIEELLGQEEIVIQDVIGNGGQKDVFLINYKNQECLLKIIRLIPKYIDITNMSDEEKESIEDQVQARLKREIKLMKLCSERIPKILFLDDYLVFNFNNKNYAFYFEEYINGLNLDEVMKEKGGYPIDEIIIFLEKMVLNLKCLQKNDIVHRDIKPANIITYNNDYFLIDLGLCRQTYEDETLTISFQTLGTRSYLSPEQRKGVKTDYHWDFRNDLYAIGLVAMEMYLPSTRVIRTENVNLNNLRQLWHMNSNDQKSKMFFNEIITKLLAENRFARFRTIDMMEEAINKIKEVK